MPVNRHTVRALGDKPRSSLLALTAKAHGLAEAKHPRLIRHIATRGRWPNFTTRWGNADLLKPGRHLDRLFKAVGGDLTKLVAVSILPRYKILFQADLPAEIVEADYLATLKHFEGNPAAPHLGVLVADWSAKAGWHWEGIVTPEDAQRLARAGYDVDARPLTLTRQARYMTKRGRVDAAPWEKAAFAEHFLTLMAALGVDRLPPRILTFGLGLAHSNYVARRGRPPSAEKPKAIELAASGMSAREIAQELRVSTRTVQRWLKAAAPAGQPQPQPEAAAEAEEVTPTPPSVTASTPASPCPSPEAKAVKGQAEELSRREPAPGPRTGPHQPPAAAVLLGKKAPERRPETSPEVPPEGVAGRVSEGVAARHRPDTRYCQLPAFFTPCSEGVTYRPKPP